MQAPTSAEIKGWTELEALSSMPATKADRTVAVAAASFTKITGLELEDVKPSEEPLVQQAIQGLAELGTLQASEDILDTLADFDLIQSFNAGPYSETRRSPADALKARMLAPWPWLSTLLWSFLTEERYDYWMAFFDKQNGIQGNRPSFEVTEVDWSGGDYFDFDYIWGA